MTVPMVVADSVQNIVEQFIAVESLFKRNEKMEHWKVPWQKQELESNTVTNIQLSIPSPEANVSSAARNVRTEIR